MDKDSAYVNSTGPSRETDVTAAINNLTRQAGRIDELAGALVKALDSVLAPAAEAVAPAEKEQPRVVTPKLDRPIIIPSSFSLEEANSARKEIEAGGFEGVLELEEFSKKPCFKGEIDTRGMKTIKEKYNPEYENNNPGKTKVVMRDITRHEINHKGYKGFKGCPRNIKNHSNSE